jgi:hypothetical protein
LYPIIYIILYHIIEKVTPFFLNIPIIFRSTCSFLKYWLVDIVWYFCNVKSQFFIIKSPSWLVKLPLNHPQLSSHHVNHHYLPFGSLN